MTIYNIYSFLFIIVYIVCIIIYLLILHSSRVDRDRFNIKTKMAAVYMTTGQL